jgi:hypothetical protein
MAKRKEEPAREKRISMEIVVDAYDAWEQAMGWYYYLQDTLRFPFPAICRKKRTVSPLKLKEKVEVIEMPQEEECEREIFVKISWQDRTFGVPLSQLAYVGKDAKTARAIEDWHYWVERGYTFG